MRRKKNLDVRIHALSALLANNPAETRGNWAKIALGRPVFLEIGCGKGRFITEMAAQNPNLFFVAVEKSANVILPALEKAANAQLDNLLFINADAVWLKDFFTYGEVSGIYINFPDPWPAKRYWKRRLTHRSMLEVMDFLLANGGSIRLKTDDARLFEFSVCELSQFAYAISFVSLDLHKTNEPNVMTEYEARFCEKGASILSLTAAKPEATAPPVQKTLYHVSREQGLLKLLPAKSSHGKAYVYAVDNVVTALLFGAKHDDFDFLIDVNEKGVPELYECYPDAFEAVFKGRSCSVYELDGRGFMRGVTGWAPELVCEHEADVERETRIDDLYGELLAAQVRGDLHIYRYTETIEYRQKICAHVADRFMRFDMLERAAADERLLKHYSGIIEALRSATDGHLL